MNQTTGTAIFDVPSLNAKTGIANRALRPLLGIVDPLNTDSCSREVHISSGLDVLFHALEVNFKYSLSRSSSFSILFEYDNTRRE